MKDLIEQIRTGDFTADAILKAADALEQQAAVIEQKNAAIKLAIGMTDRLWTTEQVEILDKSLALQPCPEVLNKVKADARREGMLAAAEICEHAYERGVGAKYQGDVFAEAIKEAAK
jgi:hypothetical protein